MKSLEHGRRRRVQPHRLWRQKLSGHIHPHGLTCRDMCHRLAPQRLEALSVGTIDLTRLAAMAGPTSSYVAPADRYAVVPGGPRLSWPPLRHGRPRDARAQAPARQVLAPVRTARGP